MKRRTFILELDLDSASLFGYSACETLENIADCLEQAAAKIRQDGNTAAYVCLTDKDTQKNNIVGEYRTNFG